jgi:hypothetical protein
MPPLLPDEALQELLVVGYRSLTAEVQRDDHVDHRRRLRGWLPENEFLVVVGHREPRAGVPLEIGPYAGHRVLSQRPRRPAAPRELALPCDRFTVAAADWFDGRPLGYLMPEPHHPRADADQPQAAL